MGQDRLIFLTGCSYAYGYIGLHSKNPLAKTPNWLAHHRLVDSTLHWHIQHLLLFLEWWAVPLSDSRTTGHGSRRSHNSDGDVQVDEPRSSNQNF